MKLVPTKRADRQWCKPSPVKRNKKYCITSDNNISWNYIYILDSWLTDSDYPDCRLIGTIKISFLHAIFYDDDAWKLVKSYIFKKSLTSILSQEENEIPIEDNDTIVCREKS